MCVGAQELFSPLACGGKLVLAMPGGEKDTQYLARLMAAQSVTLCLYVPSQLDAALQVGTIWHTSCLCFEEEARLTLWSGNGAAGT